MTIEEEIKSIEGEIRNTPYNKATSHHIGRLKAKLARLRDDLQKQAASKSGHVGRGYGIKKSGHATIVMVGFPSVGKSTLLNHLTGTSAEVAAYDFTTLEVIPGTLEYKGTRLQILDVPGLIQGAAAGRGHGKEVLSIMRNADLILIIVDIFHLEQYAILVQELYNAGIRINVRPPDVPIHKLTRGGIAISSTVELNQGIDERMIRAVLSEYRIHNADVLIREKITLDELIDVVTGNREYLRAITVINKTDLADTDTRSKCRKRFPDAILISAEQSLKLDTLKERIYKELGFIRIYMKPQGAPPDMANPLVMRVDSTVADVCSAIHREFTERFRYAQIWGPSGKHAGQHVGLSHLLVDGDVVRVVLRKR